MRNLYSVYFSGTNRTKEIVNRVKSNIEDSFNDEIGSYKSYDLLKSRIEEIVEFNEEDIVIVGAPVYYGRVPEIMNGSLENLKGNNTNAIIVETYGNREFDDALIELKDTLKAQGFNVIGAIAVVAKHSIFSELADGRPNENDYKLVDDFALKSVEKIKANIYTNLSVPGNEKYRDMGKPAFNPSGDDKCNSCGICWTICPTKAIEVGDSEKTNSEICINCGACIVNCPQDSRKHRDPKFFVTNEKFLKDNSSPKDTVFFI